MGALSSASPSSAINGRANQRAARTFSSNPKSLWPPRVCSLIKSSKAGTFTLRRRGRMCRRGSETAEEVAEEAVDVGEDAEDGEDIEGVVAIGDIEDADTEATEDTEADGRRTE